VSLDVIIVSYECRAALSACLESLLGSGVDARVTVVDNASTDGTVKMLRRDFASVSLLALQRNIGFGAAVNRAAAGGRSEELLILNPDTIVGSDALVRLREALAADPGRGAVGPRIRDSEGHLELSRGRTMSPGNDAWFKLIERLRGLAPVAAALERSYDRAVDTESLTAACLLLRRAAFDGVGGFDERFFLYGEDVDLCRRLREAGWRLRYVPSATVRHSRGISARTQPEASEIAYRRSQLAFYRKHHPAWVAWLLGRYVRTRYRCRSLVSGGAAGARARRVREALRSESGARE
jgi:GT2 family glycosyltransferase